MSGAANVPENAVGIRLWRADATDSAILNYEAIRFVRGTSAVGRTLRMFRAFGWVSPVENGYTGFAVDLLDEDESIVETVALTAAGLRGAVKKLRCRRDTSLEDAYAEYSATTPEAAR